MTEKTFLVLENASVYEGEGFGSPAPSIESLVPGKSGFADSGEVVFNTAMSGYHEVLTDPSYSGQIIVMCYPHQGNYGSLGAWNEGGPEDGRDLRRGIKAAGFVVRSVYRGPVPAGRVSLDEFLKTNAIPGITEVDTRRLTLELRTTGAKKGVLVRAAALETGAKTKIVDYLHSLPNMEGSNLIGDVGTLKPFAVDRARLDGIPGREFPVHSPAEIDGVRKGIRVALYDCGLKLNIIRELESFGAEVEVFQSGAGTREILDWGPDGILISNGPGDPAPLKSQIETVRGLFGKTCVTGICLGHQLIALALGADTYKMKFGHHGMNHPVRDERSKKVFVTSQNHGFAVDEKTLPSDVDVWFRNANDGTNEGLISERRRVYSAQFHPESAPGPHDSQWIFGAFLRGMSAK